MITMQICNIIAMFLFWLLIAINCLSFSLSVEAACTQPNKCFYPVTGNNPLQADLILAIRSNTAPN